MNEKESRFFKDNQWICKNNHKLILFLFLFFPLCIWREQWVIVERKRSKMYGGKDESVFKCLDPKYWKYWNAPLEFYISLSKYVILLIVDFVSDEYLNSCLCCITIVSNRVSRKNSFERHSMVYTSDISIVYGLLILNSREYGLSLSSFIIITIVVYFVINYGLTMYLAMDYDSENTYRGTFKFSSAHLIVHV